MTASCKDCSTEITGKGPSGRCRSCATKANRRDPEREARRIAGLRAVKGTPEHRARARAARAIVEAEHRDDPVWKANRIASGKRLRAAYDADLEAQHANQAQRASVGAKLKAQRLSWCPPARYDEYQAARKLVGAAEARRIIEADMTPFERQLARVRGGARVIAKIDTRPTDHAFTLGGIATGML